MAGLPYLPLYVGDFMGATLTWSGEERALYMLCLAYQWSSGALPQDPNRLAAALQYEPKRFRDLWQIVGAKFEPTPAGLLNLRLEEHRNITLRSVQSRQDRARQGATARWAKRDAASIAQAMPEQSLSNAKAMPVSMAQALPPIQSKEDKTPLELRPPRMHRKILDASHVIGLDAESWERWKTYRRDVIRKPIRDEHRQALKLAAFGTAEQQRAAVEHSIDNEWRGLFAPDPVRQSSGGAPGAGPSSEVARWGRRLTRYERMMVANGANPDGSFPDDGQGGEDGD